MSITVKRLFTPVQLGTSAAVLYTSTNAKTIVDKFTLCNPTGGAVTATLHIVPAAGSPSDTNKILSAKSIAAGETYTCPEMVGHILEAGETIQGLASAATSLSARGSGREVT